MTDFSYEWWKSIETAMGAVVPFVRRHLDLEQGYFRVPVLRGSAAPISLQEREFCLSRSVQGVRNEALVGEGSDDATNQEGVGEADRVLPSPLTDRG